MTKCHTVVITCTHSNKQKEVIILWAYHGTTLSGFLPDYIWHAPHEVYTSPRFQNPESAWRISVGHSLIGNIVGYI